MITIVSPIKKSLILLVIIIVVAGITFGTLFISRNTSQNYLQSRVYTTIDTTRDSELSTASQAVVTRLDGIITKIATKANTYSSITDTNAFLDRYLARIDNLENTISTDPYYKDTYSYLFNYLYPRVYKLKKIDNTGTKIDNTNSLLTNFDNIGEAGSAIGGMLRVDPKGSDFSSQLGVYGDAQHNFWGTAVSRVDGLDATILGRSSTVYLSGGLVPWIGNNNSFLYVPGDGQQLRIGVGTANTPAMTFDMNNNVGIGTTKPTATLTVSGSAIIGGILRIDQNGTDFSSQPELKLHGDVEHQYWGTAISNKDGLDATILGQSAIGYLSKGKVPWIGNNNSFLYAPPGNGDRQLRIGVGVADTPAITVTNLNNVGIGTTNPTEKLTVNGNISANGIITNSDRNLKTNIILLSGSLEKILALNGYSFDWKSSGTKDIGVIAQEVETVFPEIVHTSKEGIKSVEYGNLIAPLIESIKTQQKEIESLKAEMAILKAASK